MKKPRQRSLLGRAAVWITAALTQNLGLKLICFSLAFLLVAYHRSEEDEKTRTVAFQLDVQLPAATMNRELMTTLPPHVNVTVQGSSRALDEMATASHNVVIDLRDGKASHLIVTENDVDIPPGVTVKHIDPATLELEWQDIITRQVRVQSSVTGTVADGYEVARLVVNPPAVAIRGPAQLVNVTQFIRVAPFDVTGLSEGKVERLLALDPPPERTSYVGAPNVAVEVTVRRRLLSANFNKVPVEVVGLAGARPSPPVVDVTVVGPPEVVRGLDRELVVPRVDLGDLEPQKHGSKVLPVAVDLSRAKAEIQPPTVKVTW
jgi:YbbR domain-containing protein